MVIREKTKKRLILTIGILIVLSGFAGEAIRGWVRRSAADDLRGATQQQDVATIVALYGANENSEGPRTKPGAMVRFHGQLAGAKNASEVERLKVGDPARITYRIGRSGKVYIDNVEPLPSGKP